MHSGNAHSLTTVGWVLLMIKSEYFTVAPTAFAGAEIPGRCSLRGKGLIGPWFQDFTLLGQGWQDRVGSWWREHCED